MFYQKFVKRFFDIIIGLLGTVAFAVSYIFIAPVIYFTDKGPALFKSERRGLRDKVFIMYKYRSMKVDAPDLRNADNTTYNGKNDPRVTKIGRILRETSLDEIPQFVNVLKGDMSLVGPRPNVPTKGLKYEDIPEDRKKRLQVKSGITGYSQAYFRNSAPLEEKLKGDDYYVDNISFLLDVKIIIKTVTRIFSHSGLYVTHNEGEALYKPKTAEDFTEEEKN